MSTSLKTIRRQINRHYLVDEAEIVRKLKRSLTGYENKAIQHNAYTLVKAIRANKDRQTLIDAFLHEYQLNSDEGILLMGIAEALLRIPDKETQDLFLQEKLAQGDWHQHLHHSYSMLVNFSTQALEMTGKFEQQFDPADTRQQQIFARLIARLGQPVIRSALTQAMQQMAYQFVIAETIEKACLQANWQMEYLFSFDMLGEAALTDGDAKRYFNAYQLAIHHLATQAKNTDFYQNPGISIKLSALYPRYEPLQQKAAVPAIADKLLYLAKIARSANIGVTVDAEESERLDMSLSIFQQVLTDPALNGWNGLGLAVQAYQKRAFSVLHWLLALAVELQCKIPVRLVKGAYWDSEIKRAQVNGLSNYPVFTHKTATDLSYLACARLLLTHPDKIYPQFASHNAHTVAAILQMGRQHPCFEFQRLHGMGDALYTQIIKQSSVPCRIYAPVGYYQDLLPYLVRRLLENGANTSFINQVENPEIAIESVIADPVTALKKATLKNHCVLPKNLFGQQRANSEGLNLADPRVLTKLEDELNALNKKTWLVAPLVNGHDYTGTELTIYNPANSQQQVGSVINSSDQAIADAIDVATCAFKYWHLLPAKQRAACLQKTAELLEQHRIELVSLCVREAGKTIKDALAEIREAVDFCRYYAQAAIELSDHPQALPGPTGELNQLFQYGRGTFVCISPWNFPVAIFIGQVSAALVSGNSVIAKPAAQTSITAMRCIQLLHQAGVPTDVLQFLPGDGAGIGRHLLADNRIAGVAFTGSLATARFINQQLSKLPKIIPLIAETGGQNAMIADTSAHSEQLVQDAVQSAFNSAGQRCSALRVLYLPHDLADQIIARVIGVMQQLIIADPQQLNTDIGPVISPVAVQQLSDHVKKMRSQAKVLFQLPIDDQLSSPCFFPPTLIELSSLSQLTKENFGPILHIIRYQPSELEQLINDINNSGYGLTLGIHSRINSTINKITQQCKVGNIYINRNMISAVVGSQPFGGMGLSGTGPKAGGPHYLQRFCNEQTVSTNTTAIGGNTYLLTRDLR